MNAPGSPSSALQMRYLVAFFWAAANSHLTPVGNPAPPRPRRPLCLTSATTWAGVIVVSALRSAS